MSAVSPSFVEQQVCHFVADRSGLVSAGELDAASPIFSSGLLDSMAFLELVLFVEERFDVRLSLAGEVTMQTLDSAGAVARAVQAAQGQRRGAA